MPEKPFVLAGQPGVVDSTRAPPDRHVGWAYAHVPHGWAGDATAAIEARIEEAAPGFRDTVLERHVLSPASVTTRTTSAATSSAASPIFTSSLRAPSPDGCLTARPIPRSSSVRRRPRPAPGCMAFAAITPAARSSRGDSADLSGRLARRGRRSAVGSGPRLVRLAHPSRRDHARDGLSAATIAIAAGKPSVSAVRPASSAPTAYPRSRHGRYTPTEEVARRQSRGSPVRPRDTPGRRSRNVAQRQTRDVSSY
jgi:hypothetical protein